MWVLGCLAGKGGWWLPGCCYGMVGGCQGDAMQFLRYCRWLPVCCYVVARVFICGGRVVGRKGVVARMLLGSCRRLKGCYYAVSRVL